MTEVRTVAERSVRDYLALEALAPVSKALGADRSVWIALGVLCWASDSRPFRPRGRSGRLSPFLRPSHSAAGLRSAAQGPRPPPLLRSSNVREVRARRGKIAGAAGTEG